MYLTTPKRLMAIAGMIVLLLVPFRAAFADELPAHVRGEILIKFRDSSGSSKSSLIASFGGTVEREDRTLHYSRVKLPDGMSVEQALDLLADDPKVVWVEPNYYGWLYGAPQDPDIAEDTEITAPGGPSSWHIFQTNLFHLWRWAGGGADTVRIGIVDSGSDLTHADLAPNAAASGHKDFVDGDTNPNDPVGHGTHVTGIACAASNAIGMAGVAYEAEFVGIRVFNAAGQTTVDILTQGILWAADSTTVSVINMSLGITPNNPVYDAIAHALVVGIIPVAASGNDSLSAVAFPANIPGVISVGSVKYDTTVAVSSNYDSTLNCVAPGVGIWSTKSGGGYEYRSGTSMASPFVAGVCAIFKNKYPSMTSTEMEEYLSTIAIDLPGVKDGDGVIHFTPLEDWMDAPVAPVARHKNYAYEWLGKIATTEIDANDPMDTDGQDNVFMGKYDRDGGDDGVFPASLGDLPYVPTYIDPAGEMISLELSVSDHTGPRYGGGSDLHMDTWIDWDTDYAFTGGGEHVITDHTEDPSTWGSDTKTYTTAFTTPLKHILGNPLIIRTRLDYGAIIPGPGGVSNWGEVEDDLVVNFVEDFDIGRHGEVPYMGMGGWYLGADTPPCLNRGVFEMARADHPPALEVCTGAIESVIRMGTPPMDFTEYTEAHLDFFYCHDIFQTCQPFATDFCRVEYIAGGALIGSDPIPFGGGIFSKDLSFLCGFKDVIIDFVSATDDTGFIGIDDVVVWAFDSETHETMAAPAISAVVNGLGETHVTVDWIAVDDNSSKDPALDQIANNYEVRFSATPIATAADYFAAQPVTPMDAPVGYLALPLAPGTPEAITFRAPTGFGSRYAAVLVGDEVQHVGGHVSSGANPPVATTGVTVASLNDSCGVAGDTVTLDFTVTNGGNINDVFSLCPSATDTTDWLFLFGGGGMNKTKLLLPLGPGAVVNITMKVWIPFSATSGDTNTVDLTALSSNSVLTFGKGTGLVIVKPNPVNVAAGDGLSPIQAGLAISGPNPFLGETQIRLALPRAEPGAVRVYNLAGRMVRTLAEGTLEAGVREIAWDSRNDSGQEVSSGVYMMRLETEKLTLTRRMVRLR